VKGVKLTSGGLGAAPPDLFTGFQHRNEFHETVLDELLDERVGSSRGRRNPRKVKRKMSTYPVRPAFEPLPKRIRFQDCIRIPK
jgi:hypothetical protein